MLKKWLVVALVMLALYGGWHHWSHRTLEQPPGVLAPGDPVQGTLDQPPSFHRYGYALVAQASYTIEARILGRESYSLDREADLSPVDFALGWGPMSNTAVLDAMDISQSGRFYHLRWPMPPPIPKAVIMSHSANTHLLPATARIADELDAMRPGQVVQLSGYLVNVRAGDGWHWNTSLARTDTGDGACEVFWVEDARVVDP